MIRQAFSNFSHLIPRELSEKLVLIGILTTIITIGIVRAYISTRTGFLTIDEARYWGNAIKGSPFYGQHYFFEILLRLYVSLLGIEDFRDILSKGVFFSVLFSLGTALIYHQILRIMLPNPDHRILALGILPLTYIFMLMSGFMIPESLSLFLIIIAFYFLILSVKGRRTRSFCFLSMFFFVLSSLTRETNMVYSIAGIFGAGLILCGWRGMMLSATVSSGLVAFNFKAISGLFLETPVTIGGVNLGLRHILFGIFWGIGPWIFTWYVIGIFCMFYLFLTRKERIYNISLLLSLGGLLNCSLVYYLTQSYGIGMYSALIRFSYILVPGVLISAAFPLLTSQVVEASGKRRNLQKVALWGLGLILLGTLATNLILYRQLLDWSQTQLYTHGVDQGEESLIPSGRRGPLKLYDELSELTEPVLVIAYPETEEVSLFLLEIPSIKIIRPPRNLSSFLSEISSSDWNRVLIYLEIKYRQSLYSKYEYMANLTEESTILWSTQGGTCYELPVTYRS